MRKREKVKLRERKDGKKSCEKIGVTQKVSQSLLGGNSLKGKMRMFKE